VLRVARALLSSATMPKHTIDPALLARVTGGAASLQLVQPLRPALPDMGAPKYSAAWWDFVRARGLDR
jgi:hypothetical protein